MSYLQNMSPSQLFGSRPAPWTAPALADVALPIAVFSAGILLGAGLALFLTPKTGRQLRTDLSRQASRLGTSVRDRLQTYPAPAEKEIEHSEAWDNAPSMP